MFGKKNPAFSKKKTSQEKQTAKGASQGLKVNKEKIT